MTLIEILKKLNKMKNIKYILIVLMATFIACDGDETVEQMPGDLLLNFELMAGNEMLTFGETYNNAAGNDFNVRSFWMYLSNVKLVGAEGTEDFIVQDSYHLIEDGADIENPRLQIDLTQIPAGNYSRIEYAIGVDSEVNTDISAVARDLDPARAWNWDTGYKFVSLEGEYLPSGEEERGLIMHIGLNQNYRELEFELNTVLSVNSNRPEIDFKVDILKMFSGVSIIDFSENNTIMGNPVESGKVADNYAAGMIQLR